MREVPGDGADRLAADALHLAMSLESFTTLDGVERLGPAIRRGNDQLARVQQRRELLTMSRADEAIVDWMLEIIGARLKLLEMLHSRNRPEQTAQQVNWIKAATAGVRAAADRKVIEITFRWKRSGRSCCS